MSRRPPSPVAWCLAALAPLACGNDDRIVVPNRVLDRPLDVVLACVQDSGSQVEVLSLNQCDGARNFGRCVTDSPTPQLIGFLTNSERNELAMFRRCDSESALVDMDPEAPGYNLLPAGSLPSALAITSDSCRVVSANVGSCDFTLLDVAGLGEHAIDTRSSDPPDLPPPSTLVSTIEPRGADGHLLASSPGAMLAVPTALSLAGDSAPDPVGDEGEPDTDGAGEPIPEGNVCDASRPASVYVTFPACQLVAEISLNTQTVLQSRRFVTDDEGRVEVIDSGTDPQCPVDCPAQLQGQSPEQLELVDPGGVFPTALALVVPPAPNAEIDDAEAMITYASLFVGGPGSDALWEIEIDEDGRFGEITESLRLEDPQGIHTIRVTPAADVLGGPHQFLYVIAGDGSTRVVDRDFDPGSLGVECDTQIDPTLEAPIACHPINPGQVGNAIDRRPFAVGPGLRAPGGSTINDWTFHKLTPQQAADFCGEDEDVTSERERLPFCTPTLVGVGVTSLGTVVYSSFGQFSEAESISPAIDPVRVMRVQVRPHSLWPAIDPFAADPLPESLPLVADEEPGRGIPGGGADAQTLSPSIRRIDLAYSAEGNVSAEQQAVSDALGNPENEDQLGRRDGTGLYENGAPRVAVRDFQQWGSQTWTLEWEPTVPGTPSSTGLLQCDHHGGVDAMGNEVPGGTCRNVEPDDARLVDESANFCEDGVLAGDKLVVLGCADDDSCGLGQRCLRDPTAPTTATGICVSELAFANDDALRRDCAAFISDPCGSPQREYRITHATNGELWIAALELPVRSVVRDMSQDEQEAVDLREYAARLSCEAPIRRLQAERCSTDADCLADPYDPNNNRGAMSCDTTEVDADGLGRCTGQQPDGGCEDDEDCAGLGAQYLCVDSLCRAPCELCSPPAQPDEPCRSDDQCLQAGEVCVAGVCHVPCDDGNPGCLRSPLPGPRCFPELVRYSVRLNESFAFSGSSTPFLTDRVIVDASTGECIEDPQVSSLLTSRIRLGADAASTFGTGPWQIADCVNPDEAGPDDPNPCRIVTERVFDPDSLFHTFRYRDAPVPAIRYSNPVMSVVIDLVSLSGLTSDPPDFGGTIWPVTGDPSVPSSNDFRRSRIPSGYREEFATANGFVPFNEGVVVGSTPLVYPVRIIRAPEANADFIVDAGGRGGVAGVRGQVVRIDHGPGQVLPDAQFRVR
ncbi:MAG: hypothetical protein KDK70_06830 [Myxococcales bacterium]|nr:hypothetical protein [Myxococcales bacterium]